MKIAIASDHGGINLKTEIARFLKDNNFDFFDFGTHTSDSCDYPDYAELVSKAVLSEEYDFGILFCGTGIGMSIAANKFSGIRCAHVTDVFSARYTRLHNDSNILALGERITGVGLALMIVEEFLSTEFEGGRHSQRLSKIAKLEALNE